MYVSPASFLGATEPNLAETYLRVFCQVPHKRLSVQRARFTASFDVNPGILNIKYNIVYKKLGIGYSYDKSFFPIFFKKIYILDVFLQEQNIVLALFYAVRKGNIGVNTPKG